jgi:hypothetical protein
MRSTLVAMPATKLVMPGLVPGIHVLCAARKVVDGRDKPGHDEFVAGHADEKYSTYAIALPASGAR